jgi:hypothetical protein
MIFGKPIIRPTALADFVASEFIPYARRIKKRAELNPLNGMTIKKDRALRTQAVKVKLRRLGKIHKCQTFPDDNKLLKRRRPEWLFDIVWWDDTPGRNGVRLAVECEWSRPLRGIVDDFDKLMSVKSPLKLMIYRVGKKSSSAVREAIQESLQDFGQHVKGENYLLCEFHPDWKCEAYLFRVRQTIGKGRIAEAKFRKIYSTKL